MSAMAAVCSAHVRKAKQGKAFSVVADKWLVFAFMSIVLLGLIMMFSASIVMSEKQYAEPIHYLLRQVIYLLLGLGLAYIVLQLPLRVWQKIAPALLIITFGLLCIVLVPGIGRHVNGSVRWIGLGLMNIQVSELAKLFSIIFLANYLVRRDEEVRTQVSGFLKPMFLLSIIALLLLKEPDFGAAVVILTTALAMMFLAGVRVWQFVILLGVVGLAFAGLAISSPYRLERLTAFLDPWQNQYASGYQLIQSLIAFGRGGWFGVGLGDSVQKLFYLPEAHTDFLFAIYAEETGFVGVTIVISLFMLLVSRALMIARRAQMQGQHFSAYLGYGFSLWLAMQAMINMGVTTGLLPTKGLTLPLMSYGGSSMIVMCVVMALLIRIDYETKKIKHKNALSKERAPNNLHI